MGVRSSALVALDLPGPPIAAQRRRKSLKVPYLGQRHAGWCWAACIAMILRWMDATSKVQVWQVVELAKCCKGCDDPEPPPECHGGVPPALLAGVWNKLRIAVDERDYDPGIIWWIVDGGVPVEVVYDDKHVALLVGVFEDDDATRGFLVHDPWQQAALQEREPDGIDPLDDAASSSALVITGRLP
jgi:hypothetical protein